MSHYKATLSSPSQRFALLWSRGVSVTVQAGPEPHQSNMGLVVRGCLPARPGAVEDLQA